jgi:hypothetical protein
MIMMQPCFRYNSVNIQLINTLRPSKASLTPVHRGRESCRRIVDIFIHSLMHSFTPLSGQGSQQVHIVLADAPLRLA